MSPSREGKASERCSPAGPEGEANCCVVRGGGHTARGRGKAIRKSEQP